MDLPAVCWPSLPSWLLFARHRKASAITPFPELLDSQKETPGWKNADPESSP